MIATERVRAVVDAYVDSYRNNDRAACIALFAANAEWHDPVGEPPHVGHEGVGAFWDQARAMADSIELVPSDVIVCANQAAMVFEIHVTMGGPDAPTTMIMDAVEVFVVNDDGLIAELRAYWDMTRARARALSAIVVGTDGAFLKGEKRRFVPRLSLALWFRPQSISDER